MKVISQFSGYSKKKRLGLIVLALVLIIVVIGIANNARTNSAIIVDSSKKIALADSSQPAFPVRSQTQIDTLNSKVDKSLTYDVVNQSPDQYTGKVIQWGGKVFITPDKEKNGVGLQVYAADNDKNFIVYYADPTLDVSRDDYILVTGVVRGSFEGQNAFGASLSVPHVDAGYIVKGTRSQVFRAFNTITVDKENIQNGFTVTLQKIEQAEGETRFFVKVKNNSGQTIHLYDFDAKVVQGTTQLEPKRTYDSGEELPSEFRDGVEATGVILFPPIKPGALKLFLDTPSGENYRTNWSEISFQANI